MPRRPARARRELDERTLTAYHEAGHAVLCTAIHEPPVLVTIRPSDSTHSGKTMITPGRPTAMAQVRLAGWASEHLLTGRRPLALRTEVELAILHLFDPELVATLRPWQTDGFGAVQEVLRTGVCEVAGDIRREIEHLYDAALGSLRVVRTAVDTVARTLLEREELRRTALMAVLRQFRVADAVRVVSKTADPHEDDTAVRAGERVSK